MNKKNFNKGKDKGFARNAQQQQHCKNSAAIQKTNQPGQSSKGPDGEVKTSLFSASEVGRYTEKHFSLGLCSNGPKVKLNLDTAFTPNQVNLNSVGGRLNLFSNEWQKLTSDSHILQAIIICIQIRV